MTCNDAGKMIKSIWDETPKYYPGIKIDYYQIVPNYFHGIINIAVGADPCVCPPKEHIKTGQSQGITPMLVNEQKESGEYTVKFNASKFSSDVYYIRMINNKFYET